MNNSEEKKIICDVDNCFYNNSKEGECTLKNVCISCSGRGEDCYDVSTTLCQSFKNSGGVITDNEYEVTSECELNVYE